jgi:pyruvate dehydrogenase E1 component
MARDKTPDNVGDIDPEETKEWKEALDSVVEFESRDRAKYLIDQVLRHASTLGLPGGTLNTPYINTIPVDQEQHLPEKEVKLLEYNTDIMRWNAIAMVMRAGNRDHSLGGHIASYASIATLFEVGLNYFFRAPSNDFGGDLIFFQGHSSPGLYARAFLEGRLTKENIDGFRQELSRKGVASYPHPWLMPDFWEFPTVSMGLGPIMAIYQAHFLLYLQGRGIQNTEGRKVWAFCGDGEMGEPESLGALNIAGREKLDNLIFVINCNLQRLDGPVWGNGQIVQEYEAVYRGAGWNVIKVIWGTGWDRLFQKDKTGILLKRISELVDGEYQSNCSHDGAYLREHFFGKYPELLALVSDMTDDELRALQDGGHDVQKVYAAYKVAVEHKGQPTVILAKTVKGYGMGQSGEAKNVTHQTKKMPDTDIEAFVKRFDIPVSEKEALKLPYINLKKGSAEEKYLHEQRKKLGGFLPVRHPSKKKFTIPPLQEFSALLKDSGDREFSSTMAFVRVLSVLLKDKNIKKTIVPIVADETRTFGMEGLFRQIGIYSTCDQRYQPEDSKQLMFYREDKKGQLMQEGLSEAGGMCTWISAATAYANSDQPMIPFYIYYSMFGYQRVGDLVWAAGDMMARGFIMGGTAGRTTLNGEGLQHEDGHNVIMFSMVPNCVSYDPTFAYEVAVIIHDGLKRMYEKLENVFYYITGMNENYTHPAMPEGAEKDILKGLYSFKKSKLKSNHKVQLLGSGTILIEVIKAAEILEKEFNISADIWSATSFNELRKDMESAARYNRLHPGKKKRECHVEQCLKGAKGPVIAATDYMKMFADQVREAIQEPYYVLGTDGFGRSDTREALRDFFEVDAKNIAYTAVKALVDAGELPVEKAEKALVKLGIDADRADPVTR